MTVQVDLGPKKLESTFESLNPLPQKKASSNFLGTSNWFECLVGNQLVCYVDKKISLVVEN